MKKFKKIGLIAGILALSATAIAAPTAICLTSNKITKNSLISNTSNDEITPTQELSILPDVWENNNSDTQFVQNIFNQFTNQNYYKNNNSILISLNSNLNSSKNNNAYSYHDLEIIKTLPIKYQNKIKNGMLQGYRKLKSYLSSNNSIDLDSYLKILSPYIGANEVAKIKEGVISHKQKTNFHNKSINKSRTILFSIPTISFAASSETIGQFINQLVQVRNDSNDVAIAASIIAVAAGAGGLFYPPLLDVVYIAGLAAYTCSTISFTVGEYVNSLESEIGENVQWTTTVTSACSNGSKVGLKIISTATALNNNLDDFEEWVDDVPLLGNIIALICEIYNATQEY